MLTYTETKHYSSQEEVTKQLKAPDEWGMFTKAGNKSLTLKANALIKKLEDPSNETDKEIINALMGFLKSYRAMHTSKSMSESSDTEVRESVWCFFEKACLSMGYTSSLADGLWDLSW